MNRFLCLTPLTVTLAACQPPETEPAEPAATPIITVAEPVDKRAIVETAYANFARGDVEAPFAHVWQFVDGKVVSFRQYTDGPPWERAITP